MRVNNSALTEDGREPVVFSDSSANSYIVENRKRDARPSEHYGQYNVDRTTLDNPRKNLRDVSQSNLSFNRYRDPLLQAPAEPQRIAA